MGSKSDFYVLQSYSDYSPKPSSLKSSNPCVLSINLKLANLTTVLSNLRFYLMQYGTLGYYLTMTIEPPMSSRYLNLTLSSVDLIFFIPAVFAGHAITRDFGKKTTANVSVVAGFF